MTEEVIGEIFEYFAKINVAAAKLFDELRVGDTITIKGTTTHFTQRVSSMQSQHAPLTTAHAGDSVGIKVEQRVRKGDKIYLAAPEDL